MPSLWRDWRLYLLVLLALLLISLACQLRLPAWVDVGALGDRAYLWASPLSADTGFNGDEFLAEEGLSYRWTKRASWVRFPDMAWNGPLRVSARVRGWRPERQALPQIDLRVNGLLAGRFEATGDWQILTAELDHYPGSTADLEVLLECPPFSAGGADRRVLGVQLDWVRVDPLPGGPWPTLPAWRQALLWATGLAFIYVALRRWLKAYALWPLVLLAVLVAAGFALRRHWLTPYTAWVFYAAASLAVLSHVDLVLYWLRALGRRARPSLFGAVLAGAGVTVVTGYVRWAVEIVPGLAPRPDAILVLIFFALAILYALVTWDRQVRRLFARLDGLLRQPWLPGALVILLLAGVTIYGFGVIRDMQFIGHADYADNAVVARNLLAGRGFAVDYVTQYYNADLPLSHPQETWPLLQPVLIAPFFQVLGASPFAAKLPSLFLQLALALVLYALGTNLFDRRVGLVAVLLTLLNPYTFRLIIFPTSDLAFTLFALLTVAQFFRASERERAAAPSLGSYAWAGVWAGLMMLAKPNGVLYVGIAVLWDLFRRWREFRWKDAWKAWLAFGLPAAALFAPWVLRNLLLFGAPVHSTERFDAWILKYQEWEQIYRLYFDDLPNRSWLLRYGFDRVSEAIGTEFRKWWQYFSVDTNALLTLTGSALALLGTLVLRQRDSDHGRAPIRLFSLVGPIFFLFGTFICTYWHVEERYFVPFIPWLALLAARGLWWIHDTLAYRRDEQGRTAPTSFGWLGLLLVVLACVQMVSPFPQEAIAKWQLDQDKRQELRAYAWLAENSAPDDVIMTRVPWQLTYYTQRRSVMIPQDGLEDAQTIIGKYGVRYLFMDGDARGKRATLRQALQSDPAWKLLYDEGGIQIYQVP